MKYTKKQRIREKSLLRKRRRELKVKRRLRIRRSCRKRLRHHRPRNYRNFQSSAPIETSFTVPNDFSISNNVDGVMNFINFVYSSIKRTNGSQIVSFEMDSVTNIDNMAISILLALVNSISRRKCFVKGTSPINNTARDIFCESGFYEHVEMIQGKRPTRRNTNNLMIEAGTNQTKNKMVGREIRKAMLALTGKSCAYQPVYSIIQEICGNSVEHANTEQMNKNWLISVFYEDNTIKFSMVDIGKGILGTLRKKTSQKFRDAIQLKDGVDMLRGAFTKQYQSATWDINRNKGLPKINDYQEKGFIGNLMVVTNNILLDFSGDNSHEIKTNFKGTFYTWTLTIENINKWKTRIK